MRFTGKTVFVTGGASGMGRAAALKFAAEGASVVVADIDAPAAPASPGSDAVLQSGRYVHLDVTREDDWIAAAKLVQGLGKGLDVLVNNAGISGTFDPDLQSTTAWDRLMAVNAKGVFLGMKHMSPLMHALGKGAIVNMSSISASVGQHGVHMAYAASKGAVQAMTRAAAVQYAAHGIRVNAIAPGMLPAMRTSRGSADPEWRKQQIAAVPLGRAGDVDEVAAAVLFLASDEAAYITGTELVVDGGFLSL